MITISRGMHHSWFILCSFLYVWIFLTWSLWISGSPHIRDMTDQRRRGPGVCRWRTGARPGVGVTPGEAGGWLCSPPPAPGTGAPGSLSRGRGTLLVTRDSGDWEAAVSQELRGERRNQVACGLRQSHRWRPGARHIQTNSLPPCTGHIDSTHCTAHTIQ